MIRVRTMVALAIATTAAILGGTVGPASAGQLYEKAITAECNTTTGEYDVTLTLSNAPDAPLLLADAEYEYTGPDGEQGPFDTAFDPSTLPIGGSSVIAISIPGDSTDVIFIWYVRELDDIDRAGDELDGDCVAIPTTTTTAAPTTSTTAAAQAAAVAAPRFTG
jgi:hypothetical protein